MKFLINRGIDINAFRREGETPRHYAVRMGSREKVELLLESGGWHNQKCEGLDPSWGGQGEGTCGSLRNSFSTGPKRAVAIDEFHVTVIPLSAYAFHGQ